MNRLFLDKVMGCINKYKMITDGDAVLVGVSGGIDSITLLYSLYFLRDSLKCSLIVAHANHGLRGEESDKEAEFVREIADGLKLPCVIEKFDILKYIAEKGLSKQVAARELRYDFFERTEKQYSANKIALGHTADDQAETVLMRLLRGSGMKGMGGIRAVRACSEQSESNNIIRPLIEVSRDEVAEFAAEKGLRYVEDPSNLKTEYLRNKIRLNLIPLLKKEYNPSVIRALSETAEIIRDEDEFLEDYCSNIFSPVVLAEGRESVEIDVSKLKGLHIAIQRRIIRIAIKRLKGNLLKISAVHIEDILNSINKGFSGKSLNLPDGIHVLYEYGRLKIKMQDARYKMQDVTIKFDISLKIPGETILSIPPYKFKTEIISREDLVAAGFSLRNKYTAFFDMDKLKGELRIRNRRAEDIFHPSGMKGSKKLKEFFIDEKIPQRERGSIPLIVLNNKILWVVGKRVTEDGKVDENTKRILKVLVLREN
ncbi:MAG: tRNA lysidine(34) synthetase TilS [Nitrospinae bacterium RIFCSPLOWO2_02_39_17]|nr:MAG: tRNA lysidine(34) synthetase TilS [Nitrospinae bacterium RIFCSPLOWO2_02_39_17]